MAITGKGTSQDFGYTGGIQSITLPFTGLYLLQVWGASGGNSSYGTYRGYGGYVYTYRALNKGQVLYIGVGGQGGTGSTAYFGSGGYNGGGAGGGYPGVAGSGGGGGGASHISLYNGVLSSAYGGALVVAGGGGGGGYDGNGGNGGGASGLGTATNGSPGQGTIGYPNSGYTSNCYGCGGGGGGMYGGTTSYFAGGSGGSGYIAVGSVTFNGAVYNSGYGGTQDGNGYARITFVDVPSQIYFDSVNAGKVVYNGTTVSKVIYNGTTVYG